MKNYKIQKPFLITIFGASGNLAKLKLFPSLYSLMINKRFPKDFHIVGYARSPMTRKQFQKLFIDSVKKNYKGKVDLKALNKLTEHLQYFSGQYNKLEDFQSYRDFSKKLSSRKMTHIAYFSIPPAVYKSVIENLGETKTATEDIRLVIEKPFGEDNKSAKELFHFTARYFDEQNVYLLDHYLGKTAVQAILDLRHANRLLNTMLKGREIANIQITASETVGVGQRAGYFDTVGTIKDMFQSHLLQVLGLITMSIPITEDSSSLHREKYAILSALKFIPSPNNIALGQYESYTKEPDIPSRSKTETFAAAKLFIDRESWYKVPIYLRSGKHLHEKHTYITIEIKKIDFQDPTDEPNLISIELQPEEKISIRLLNKHQRSGSKKNLITSESIACKSDDCLPEHSLLLLEVLQGHTLHFASFPEVITSWRITDQITKYIKKSKIKVEKYKKNSSGPKNQHKLTTNNGFIWHDLH